VQSAVSVIASPKTWIESEAVPAPGDRPLAWHAAGGGHADLHPGKGAPIGAVFACAGVVYPYLIGNDIGCGMCLWRTDLPRKRSSSTAGRGA
jgi:release factor H-coupled RctB family protein